MRLSDIKGEEAFEVMADLIDPLANIAQKEEVRKADKSNKLAFIQVLLRNCKAELLEMLAILDRKPVDEYREEFNLAMLPGKVIEMFNDPAVLELFGLQGQTETSLGSATENTGVEEK